MTDSRDPPCAFVDAVVDGRRSPETAVEHYVVANGLARIGAYLRNSGWWEDVEWATGCGPRGRVVAGTPPLRVVWEANAASGTTLWRQLHV